MSRLALLLLLAAVVVMVVWLLAGAPLNGAWLLGVLLAGAGVTVQAVHHA